VEGAEGFLIQLVRARHPGMLALMFDPAFDDETFEDSARFGYILPDVPADGAVTLPDRAETTQGGYEFCLARRFDPIIDLDQNRAAVSGGLQCHDRFGPVVRRGQIGCRVFRKAPAEREQNGHPLPTIRAVPVLVPVASVPQRMLPPVIAPWNTSR
jgi:hypothetical protein